MRENWDFAQAHLRHIQELLALLPAGLFLDFAIAAPDDDMKHATDMVLNIDGGAMAIRLRRQKFWRRCEGHPDWSVRYCVASGGDTEMHKLRAGFADWYFFGYSASDQGIVGPWWLIDLNRVRAAGLFDGESKEDFKRIGWQINPSGGGVEAMYFPVRRLLELGCIPYASMDLLAMGR